MKCYHMTSLDRLESINREGLVPRNEKNSKLVNDQKVKVFFSEGFEGAIALYVDFDITYNRIKNKEEVLEDASLNSDILSSKDLEDYLKDGVYLSFEMENIVNERNFENGCTSKIIKPNRLNVVLLKSKVSHKIVFSRFEVIKYMMAKTNVDNIKYYGALYPNSPDFIEATKKIQNKVKKYYDEHSKEIDYYKINDYEMIELSLNSFLNKIKF